MVYKELTRAEKLALFEDWLDGVPIEMFIGTYWAVVRQPLWADDGQYRVQPSRPSIDWSAVDSQYQWLATDSDGKCYLYEKCPTAECGAWVRGGDVCVTKGFSSLQPGACNWTESLVERPSEK